MPNKSMAICIWKRCSQPFEDAFTATVSKNRSNRNNAPFWLLETHPTPPGTTNCQLFLHRVPFHSLHDACKLREEVCAAVTITFFDPLTLHVDEEAHKYLPYSLYELFLIPCLHTRCSYWDVAFLMRMHLIVARTVPACVMMPVSRLFTFSRH